MQKRKQKGSLTVTGGDYKIGAKLFEFTNKDAPSVRFETPGFQSLNKGAIVFDPKGKRFAINVSKNGVGVHAQDIECKGVVEISNFDSLNIQVLKK